MTLKKYIQRLTDKLDRDKQFDKKIAVVNMRKARSNHPIALPFRSVRSRLIALQHWRYGWPHWLFRRKRGLKNERGELLPLIRVPNDD